MVKNFLARMMQELKNLKVSKEHHRKLKVIASTEDVPLQMLTECAIDLAVKERKALVKMTRYRKNAQNGQS